MAAAAAQKVVSKTIDPRLRSYKKYIKSAKKMLPFNPSSTTHQVYHDTMEQAKAVQDKKNDQFRNWQLGYMQSNISRACTCLSLLDPICHRNTLSRNPFEIKELLPTEIGAPTLTPPKEIPY